MFVNLTDVLNDEGRVAAVHAAFESKQITVGGETFPVKDSGPVELTFVNTGKGSARITGGAEVTLAMRCDRCLRDVDQRLELRFDREVFAPDALPDVPDAEDDQRFMDGWQMDVDGFLNNEIVMNLPMKILCKPDCKGICRQCGMDLNTGTCGCDTFVPDPRMAAIKDIFNGIKEV